MTMKRGEPNYLFNIKLLFEDITVIEYLAFGLDISFVNVASRKLLILERGRLCILSIAAFALVWMLEIELVCALVSWSKALLLGSWSRASLLDSWSKALLLDS